MGEAVGADIDRFYCDIINNLKLTTRKLQTQVDTHLISYRSLLKLRTLKIPVTYPLNYLNDIINNDNRHASNC